MCPTVSSPRFSRELSIPLSVFPTSQEIKFPVVPQRIAAAFIAKEKNRRPRLAQLRNPHDCPVKRSQLNAQISRTNTPGLMHVWNLQACVRTVWDRRPVTHVIILFHIKIKMSMRGKLSKQEQKKRRVERRERPTQTERERERERERENTWATGWWPHYKQW